VAVLSIGSDDRILRRETWHGTDRDRLLTDVEMQEAADLAPAIKFCALLLKPPDAEHLAQKVKGMIAIYNGIHFFSITGASCQRTLTLRC
jgi:predicted nuclease with RNAse H fold